MEKKIFAALVTALFIYVALPLFLPVAMGAVIAVLFVPWQERLEARKIRAQVAAGMLTAGITLLLILPSGILIFFGARTGLRQIQAWKATPVIVHSLPSPVGPSQPSSSGLVDTIVSSPTVQAFLERMSHWFPIRLQDLIDGAQDLTKSVVAKIAELLGELFSHLPGMTLGLIILIVSIYFFLVDGRKLVLFVRRNSFFSTAQTDQFIYALQQMCRSVILASLISGLAQAVCEIFFVLVTGTPNPLLAGLLVLLASFVPLVGAAPITIGISIQQLLLGRNTAGIVLMVGALLISTLDNFIRPVFIQGRANLHPFLVFVAALGGLQAVGFTGIFLGPVAAGMFVVTVQILLQGDVTDEPTPPVDHEKL